MEAVQRQGEGRLAEMQRQLDGRKRDARELQALRDELRQQVQVLGPQVSMMARRHPPAPGDAPGSHAGAPCPSLTTHHSLHVLVYLRRHARRRCSK